MHKNAIERSREERVQQVRDNEKSIYDLASYIPIGNAIRKIQSWKDCGAEIYYLSPYKRLYEVVTDKTVLVKFNFPNGPVLYRKRKEQYKDIVKRVLPDIIIEDDCESIGGEKEMTFPQLDRWIQPRSATPERKTSAGVW
jgi:hypothetical protein